MKRQPSPSPADVAADLRERTGNSAPRVAVVIPCFNDGEYLVEALDSLRYQEPVELVVVDDGSDDPLTLECLAELREGGVRVVRQDNQGLSAARMAGVRATAAPLVHPLDADDRLRPGALTLLADALEGDLGAAVAWGDAQCFGASQALLPAARVLDPWRITYLNEIPASSMVRRHVLSEVGGWDMGSGFEDWDLWMKLAEAGHRGVHVEATTLLYRIHHTPRMYQQTRGRIRELQHRLRERHSDLYRRRGLHRKASASPPAIKVAWSVIDRVPGLSYLRRHQLIALARYWFEPEMASDGFRGVRSRLRARIRRWTARSPFRSPARREEA